MKYLGLLFLLPLVAVFVLIHLLCAYLLQHVAYPLWHLRPYRPGSSPALDEWFTESKELALELLDEVRSRLIKLFYFFRPTP